MEIRTHISKSGRIIIPARLRKALEIQAGDEILLQLENGSIRLLPLRQAVAMAQANVRKYTPQGLSAVQYSLVEELIQQRREEAAGE